MNKEEYEARFKANIKYSGHGLKVQMHMPCPFCAEADWCVCLLLDTTEELLSEHVCKGCGRGAKLVMRELERGTAYSMRQTRGEDPPDYASFIPRLKEEA